MEVYAISINSATFYKENDKKKKKTDHTRRSCFYIILKINLIKFLSRYFNTHNKFEWKVKDINNIPVKIFVPLWITKNFPKHLNSNILFLTILWQFGTTIKQINIISPQSTLNQWGNDPVSQI